MLKKWNRSLAILLAFALVVTTFGSDWASTRAFAVGSEEELTLLEDIGDNTVDAQQDNQDGQNQDQQSENQDQQPENQDQQPENQGQQSETPAQENTDPETTADDAAASEAGAAGDDAANTGDTISGDAAAADNTGAATEATTVEAATEATTAEAATEATTAEEAATAATSAEVKEKLVTVTYKSTKGGRVSKSKETVDINKKDAKFEGAKAEAWNDEYTFVDWTDADGNQVCTEATFVPSGLEADAVFTANFIAEEDIADKMPGIEANNVHKGGMVVSVKAEIGVFPKGTEVEINPVSDAQALETAQQVMENATQAKGVDITFYYTNEDGVRSEIQPADGKYVHVELALDDAIEGEEFSVIHEHDGVVEEINATISTQDANSDPADDTKEATAVSFNSTQFSVFVVANNGSTEDQSQDLHATLTYNFYTKEGDAEPYNTQIVVEGETLHDPGYPPLEQDEEFLGWYYQKDGQKTKVEFTTVGNVTSGEVINCYADIKTTYYVTFIGYKGEVVQVKKLTVTTGQSTKINLEKETYTPDEAEEVFKGWTTDKVKPNPDTRTVVKEIDASKDHYVYAVVVKGYWIRFDENDGGSGGGASYTGPKAVFEGQAAIGSKPNDPTRPGYDFGGWYEKAGANPGEVVESSAFNWDGTLSKDITLYAKWTPKTKTKYTVIIWQQQAEEESKYDYKASYSLEGKTDTVITDDMLSDYIDHPDKGFKYNASKKTIVYGEDNKSTTIIRAKGDTVVNLYFDRETYTLTFRKKQGGWITSYSEVTTITARYGVNIYGNFPIKVGNTTYRNGWEVDSDSQTYKEGTYLDYIVNMPPENITFTYYNEDPDGYATFIYYVEALEGDTIATNHNGIGFKVLRSVPLPWQRGMKSTEAEEFMDIKGYSKLDSSPAYWNGTANVSVGGTMKLYYKRNRHSIDFYDNFNGITTKVTDVNSKFASVPFEQNLSTYKDIAPKLDDIEGYTFAGWFQDKSGKVPFNWSSTMPDSQLVLYAYYTPVQYHVHLNPDDGTLPEGQKADFDVDYKTILSKTSLEKTTKAGYELVGWFDDKTNFAYGYGEIAEDVNLTARWRSPGTVGITYDGNGHGSGAPEDEYEYYKNSAVVVAGPPTTIEKGFTFLGWKVNNSGTMLYPNNSFVIDPSIIVGGKVTLYAQYEEYGKEGSSETTTITYHANNETDATYTIPVGEEELKKNQGVIALSAADAGFSYTGYKFIGWAKTQEDAAAGTVFVNAGQKIAANNLNTTLVDGVRVGNDLYAVWEREKGTYTVNYYKDSTEGTLLDTKTYTVDLPYTVVIESGTAQGQIDWKKPLGYKSGVVDNNNYDVQADIKDESGAITNPQVINIVYTKLKITITIEAKDDSRPYTGEDQTLTGVKSVSIKDEDGNDVEGLTKDNIILANGGGSVDSVSVTGKNVGPYPMGLTNESFTLNTDAFTVDKWVVTDGTLTITKLPVTVTITGTQQTDKYDGKDHTAEGWDITNKTSDLYPDSAVKINGEAKATQKDVGKKDMGLKGTPKDGDDFTCSFINTDENFDVTFVVIDGYQEITPVSDKVTVKISGNQTIKTYTGDTFTADGYTVDIDDETYTENDFRLKSDAQGVNIHLSSADVCELSMGLTKDSFENTNANFTNVEFVIEQQGLLKITPAAVTVTITGTKEEGIPYDGEDHTVNGFTASANNTLYNVTEGSADFTFNFDGGEADSWNTASATQKEVGTAYMRLADSMFTNNNDNFEVTWDIKDGSVEVVKKILTVKIKGNKDSKEYTGSEQQVEGYTISNESELGDYPTSAISFTGEAVAKGKEVDTYPMNLDISKFTNSNTNYQVTFELAEDGELEITPVTKAITVEITGNSDTKVYNGTEQKVSGYTVTKIDDPTGLYTEDDIAFSGEAVAKGTDVDTYPMNLKDSQFSNRNTEQFSNVTIKVVKDGELKITPLKVNVDITGKTGSTQYDGQDHTTEGYKFDSDNDLYTEALVDFTGTKSVTRKEFGKTSMNLAAGQFKNKDTTNFDVTFNIVSDGYQEITKLPVTVTITGTQQTDKYDGKDHTAEGWDITNKTSNLYPDTAVKINGEAKATQKDVGKKDMGLKGTPKDGDDFTCSFINTDENFDVTFVVIDGYQEITPVSDKVTVKISGNQTIKTYTGDTFTADGYTVDIDDETYTENDFRLKSDAQGVNIHLSSADVCELSMGLTKDSFENTNANFTNVEFVIEQQGLLKITPAAVTVTITGTKEEGIPYDGEDHTVNGFTASANNTLYNVTEGSADFTFNFDGGEADSWNTASATQKEVGTAYMRLADSMFTNNNDNFEVTWDIKDGSVEVVKKILTVKIKGNKDSKEYTGSEQQVEGYTISNESELGDYPTSAISFTGEAVAKGKEVDTYPMNLDISKFTNSNTNYQVTFELAEDGELKITPVTKAITVEITGNSDTKVYNGTEQKVSGYTVTKIDDPTGLYTEDDIAFSGEAVAKGTDVDTYPMNLKDSQFSNGNTEQFSNVTIKVVKDGVLEITPLKVTVTITGNNDSVFYDGQTHTVSEFTSKIEGSDLYTEDDFEYDGNTLISETDVNRDENGDVTKYLMGLDAEKFVNNNNNFDPTFVIAEDGDGYLLINPLEASVTVQGDRVTAPYDNKLHEASGWKVLEETISNPLLSKDAIALNEGVSAYVARKDVGKDTMNLTTDDFYCKDGNFDVTITVEDGYVDITPIENIVVKINGTKATEEYNGQPHKAADFDVIISDASGLFQKTDITFSPQGKVTVDTNNVPYVEATDVKRDSEGNVVSYPMGLLKEMFSCTDERFKDVTFELESDGELTITPVSMNIAVEGDKKTYTYNGKDHTAEGYKATSTGEFFDETKVIYAKDKPVVTKKDKGTYSLELDENDFSYDDKNVDVTFSVQNGELVIDPLNITIDIVGDYIEKHIKFDGNEHTTKEAKPAHEKGYAVDYNDATAIIEDEDGNPVSQTISKADIEKIYDEAKIAFSGEAIAKGTLARAEAYTMGLTEGQFSNTDDNFVVKFVVKDGYLYIDSRGADAYKITISSQDVHSPYNGLEQSYTILAGVKDATATNPVAATLNKIAEMVDNFFSLKVGAEDGEKEVVVDGVTYVVHNLKVTATGKDYNETGYAFAFETAPTVTLKGEDVTGEFDIIPSLGKLYIDKVPVTITVDNKTKVQGAGDPTFTSKIEGLQGSDTLALGYTRATGEAPGNYQINVTATKEALESDYKNYTFTIVPGTLTITAPAPTPAPDDPTPTPTPTPTPIQDNPTPTAPAPTPVATPAPQAVLGAQRETGNGQAVLGARRAKTEDETNDMARVIAIVMSAVAAVMLMLAGKKKEDEEES